LKVINKYLPTYLIIGISGIPFLLNDNVLIIYFLYILIRVFQTKTKILWIEVFTILAFVIIFCIQYYVFKNFSFMTLAGIVLRMLTGLFYLKIEGKEFITKYIKTMYFICLISMVIYLLFNLLPGLYEYTMRNAFENKGEWISLRTIFIYQFSPICPVSRNIGPFWEPGVFGIFINISLFFKLFLEREKLNKAFLEIASLLTTLSTTNYLILFVLLTFYFTMDSKHIMRVVYLIGSITLFIIIFLNTDFLYNKLSTQIEQAKVEKLILNEGRFVSIIRDYGDFKKSWMTGTGFSLKNRLYYSPWRAYSNCGFTDIVVKLGLLGSIFYFTLFFRGTSRILRYYNNKSIFLISILFLLVVFIASISEVVYSMSLFLGIAILGASERTSYSLIQRENILENPAGYNQA
jgi:hypothetical protein